MRKRIQGVLLALLIAVFGLAVSGHAKAATGSKPAPPAATLGIWTAAEDGGSYSTISGQHPNIANDYIYWGNPFPTSFANQAEAAGATPFIEIEPWQGVTDGQPGDCTDIPLMTTIGANNNSSYISYLQSLGAAIQAFGHPVILTFAHEFNVGGQYPWSLGDCENTTPQQWIQAWDAVVTDVNNAGGSQYAYWMWVPNADTGGDASTGGPIDFTAWWPGANYVDMVGLDGYPQSGDGWGLCNFSELFGQSFTEMKSLTSLPIFIAETNLSPLDGTGNTCNGSNYQSLSGFMTDLFNDGGTGVLEWEDQGIPQMTSTQWSELDAALQNAPGGGGTGCQYNGAPQTSPPDIGAAVTGSKVVLSWGTVGGTSQYEVQVALPNGTLWHDSIVTATSATYSPVPTTGTYHYKVRAENCFGDGPWSAVKTFTVTQ